MQEMLSLILGSYVREVMVACSGKEAMKRMECVQPSLIVADICMASKGGYDLIPRVRAKGKNRSTPAVARNAYSPRTRALMPRSPRASTCS